MVTMHVSLTVRNASDIAGVEAALVEHARRSRAEPGCLRFEAYRSNLDPHAFFLLEAWESQDALEVHRKAESFETIYAPRVLGFVDRAAHPVAPLPE